jgi:hypothetical protein
VSDWPIRVQSLPARMLASAPWALASSIVYSCVIVRCELAKAVSAAALATSRAAASPVSMKLRWLVASATVCARLAVMKSICHSSSSPANSRR